MTRREEVFRKLTLSETPSLTQENRRLHRFLIEGVPVEIAREDGSIGGDAARLIDFEDLAANDWLAVNQFTVIENKANRRPDVVIFVNGLPLGVIELKNPGDENATLDGAFNQLQTYKAQIPSLFRTNAALVISDGLAARIGSLTADRERFMPWRTVTGDDIAPKGTPELETLLKGVFEKRNFLNLIKDFVVFGDTDSGLIKILAGYHQFHAVRHAVARTIKVTRPDGDRKVGVVWHTPGAPAFFAKAEMGSVRFQQRKICWRLLPSEARVRPASAAAHNSPSVRCTPQAYANDLTPCRMTLHFDYASAAAPTSSKRPAPTATRGSSYTAPLALRFLYSFEALSADWASSI